MTVEGFEEADAADVLVVAYLQTCSRVSHNLAPHLNNQRLTYAFSVTLQAYDAKWLHAAAQLYGRDDANIPPNQFAPLATALHAYWCDQNLEYVQFSAPGESTPGNALVKSPC